MTKNYYVTIVMLLTISFSSLGQTICDITTGMAGIYPCNDYDLMAQIPIADLADMSDATYIPDTSDIWGWTDPLDNKEYAIIAFTNSTAFIDITNPTNPILLGRVNTAAGRNSWRDVKVYNNHAFIVADNTGAHGMQVFDLTILRNGVDPDLTFDGPQVLQYTGSGISGEIVIGSCHNIAINESEGVAYLVGCRSANGGGPIFVDISTPSTPNILGSYTTGGYSHDAQIVTYTGPDKDYYDPANGITGRQIYIGSNGNTDKVVILDVTDKTNIIPISDFTYTQTSYAHQGWFTEDQKYFLLGDELDERDFGINTKTLIFDFSDLDADFDATPSLTRFYLGPNTAIDHNGYVKGNNYYLANYRAGMRVLDITNIDSATPMTEVGYFDTYPPSNTTGFNGTWSIYPYFASGNIIISDIERGLFIVRKSNTPLSTAETNVTPSFSVAPNPSKDFTNISSNTKNGIQSVSLYNLLGQKIILVKDLNITNYKLNTNNIKSGIYMLTINNKTSKKLVIE